MTEAYLTHGDGRRYSLASSDQQIPVGAPLPSRVAAIVNDVAARHHVKVSDLCRPCARGRDRFAISLACFEAAYRLRSLDWAGKPPSYERIGRWLNRDHTSIIHAIKRHKEINRL